MPTQQSQANAEGMPEIQEPQKVGLLYRVLTRRGLLRSAPAASVAIAVPAAADIIPMSAKERVDFHLAEFKRAAAEVAPRIRFSRCVMDFDAEFNQSPLFLVAQWARGFYNGDGNYKSGSKYSRNQIFAVKLLDRLDEGERVFSVVQIGEQDKSKWMNLTETELEAFIGEKIDEASA